MDRFATLKCPDCGFADWLAMPLNACTYFHPCSGCGTVLRPKPGDCCVFCSYSDRRCPSKQSAE
ncbi:MAG: GDCCVxC domain-containing (seleno)protein [Gemmatimonadaceae bacterium]